MLNFNSPNKFLIYDFLEFQKYACITFIDHLPNIPYKCKEEEAASYVIYNPE